MEQSSRQPSERHSQTKSTASCPRPRPLRPPNGVQLSQRESPWQRREVSAQRLRLPLRQQGVKYKPRNFADCQGLSLWERWHRGAMTERASPLPAAHRVRLDSACDRTDSACDRTDSACDRADSTCDKSNGFIFPTHDHLLPPLPVVASGLRQSPHRARGVARHIISDAIKIRCARRLTPPGTPLRGIVISPAYNVGRCK